MCLSVGAPHMGVFMLRFLAILLAVLVLAPASAAQEADPQITRYKLPNGLEIILAPDRRVPKVVLTISYRVGSLNEPPGRAGFAHLFEHLMFAGTPTYPNIDEAYGAIGVGLNAWTFEDRTLYYSEGLSSTLPYMLALEADRMANQGAAITREDLDVQRAVVLNEMRENILDAVNGAGWTAFRAALYPAPHPYGRGVLGSMADLQAATIGDVHGFFATYYVPNNATLVLVGDFAVEDVKALIGATFARVPRSAPVPRPAPAPLRPSRARIELEDSTPVPTIAMGWATPTFAAPENGALRLAADLIGNGEYGLLRQRLIDTGLASGSWVWLERGYLGGRFMVEVSVAEGVEPEAVEAELRRALSDFGTMPIDPADLERARLKLLLGDRVAAEPFKARAELIAVHTEMLDRPQAALADDPAVRDATAVDVATAASRYLSLTDAATMIIRPGGRGSYPAVLTNSSGQPEPFRVVLRDATIIPPQPVRERAEAELPERQTATLSNGIEVVHYQLPDAPMAYIAAVSRVGTTGAPEGKEGIVELAAMMGTRGAGDLSFSAFAKAAKDLGADVEWKADHLGTFLILSGPAENLARGVTLFAEAVRKPRFDAAEWRAAMAETLEELSRREGDLPDVARRVGEAQIFPKQPGRPAVDRSLSSVRGILREEAQVAFRRIFNPDVVAFHSVSALPLTAVVAELERGFGDWRAEAAAYPVRPRPPASFPPRRQVLLVPEPGASQAAIYVATPAPGVEEPGNAESVPVFRLLAYDFTSRLMQVIREQKGYSYGTNGSLLTSVRRGSAMIVEAPVERDHAGDALAEMFKGFASLAADPVRPEELNRTVTATLTAMAGTAETAAGLFEAIRTQLGQGSTLEEAHAQNQAITRLQLEEVRAQAAALADLERAIIVVVGDPEIVRPQLEALQLQVLLHPREEE